MKPLPVAVRLAEPACVDGVSAIGVSVGTESNGAGTCDAPPQSLLFVNAGAMHCASDQVNNALFLSAVRDAVTPTNDAAVSKPHDARNCVLKGILTWWVTSTIESILLVAPQYTLKSAARWTVAVIASSLRNPLLFSVLYARGSKMPTPAICPAVRSGTGA